LPATVRRASGPRQGFPLRTEALADGREPRVRASARREPLRGAFPRPGDAGLEDGV